MTSQLHLDVAQLTDVGRKREHNEDNMAYVIPKDPEAMAKKGALFIVADGMGGHAAGEVASEIAVDTVSNAYYQDDNDDVAESLLHAIRRANAAIHQRAAENMLRSGMGTTCVAAILRGNHAYIANVGDSRAYLLRNTSVRQVSQDHSWVAEQVRAGLLTEEQARTHAQRNVITRCLGTQADVDIDIFSEELEQGDSLILCTDGLSGLVSDEELQRIVNQYVPQESVYHLVERANENGGPDNITAIVVRVQEVGVEPPNVRHPVRVGGRENVEDTKVLRDGINRMPTARTGEMRPTTVPLRIASGPLVSPESGILPQPVAQELPPGRHRLFYPSLALLVLIVLTLVSGGIYYFIHKSQDVEQLLQNAQNTIDQANGNLSASPGLALSQLAQAQSTLRRAQKNKLSTAQSTRAANLLNNLTKDVQVAIDTYNASPNAAISVLPCDGKTPTVINEGSANTTPESIVSVQVGKTALLYALGQDGNIYWLKGTNNFSLQGSNPLPQNTQALALAGDGDQLFALYSQANGGYSLSLYHPDASGNLGKAASTVSLSSKFTQDGKTPYLITVSGQNFYMVLASNAAPTNALLLHYSVTTNQLNLDAKTLSVSGFISGIAALPGEELFLLLPDGIKSVQFATGNSPVSVQVAQLIVPPLAIGDQPFQAKTMNVPLPQKPPQFLDVAGASSLTPGIINPLLTSIIDTVPHLYISDPVNHRIIDLVVGPSASPNVTPAVGTSTPPSVSAKGVTPTSTSLPTNVTLQLFQQVVSANFLSQMKSIAVNPQAMTISALILMSNNPTKFGLIPISTGKQTNCMTQQSGS